jgi:hypothetical protein
VLPVLGGAFSQPPDWGRLSCFALFSSQAAVPLLTLRNIRYVHTVRQPVWTIRFGNECGRLNFMSEQSRWQIPQKLGDWVAEMTWTEGEIQGGPSMLVIRPKDPDNVPAGGLSSTVLREVDFKAAAATMHELMRESAAFMELIRERQKSGRKTIDFVREALAEGVTDDYLALLAMEYVGRVNTGQEKPVDHIAEELGRSLGTVKGHLWQARKRGLLTGGSAGRKGGDVSEEAYHLARNWSEKQSAKADG